MRSKLLLISVVSLAMLSHTLYGRKKPKAVAPVPVAQMNGDQKILHALNRLTFGARPGDVEEVKRQGLQNWIEAQLHPETIAENPLLEARLEPLETLRMSTTEMLRKYPSQQMIKAMADGRMALPEDPQTRAAVQTAIARLQGDKTAAVALRPLQTVNRDLIEGKLLRAIYSNRQLDVVLTDFWYNHFNVYLDKGADRSLVTAYERDVIHPHVLGKFRDMLVATAQSPAMLFYLDNWQSAGPDARARPNQKKRQGLNENYGRELMELHTLGVDGGYTQQDVTEVARCFTGWTMKQPQQGSPFQFNARMHDNGEKHVLGVTIPAGGGIGDGLQVLDILAKHPSTAHFIAKSLAIRFVADNPPETLVAKMAMTFSATDGDLREVMRTMLSSPEFWAPEAFRSKLKSPLEMVVSAVRAVNGDVENATAIAALMRQLGQPLYRKQEPTGYSNQGGEWMNSASLLARMNFASALAQAKIRGVKPDPARLTGSPEQIERSLLMTEPSPDALAAIQAGLDEQKQMTPGQAGPLVAGLTLGSPDFQRR